MVAVSFRAAKQTNRSEGHKDKYKAKNFGIQNFNGDLESSKLRFLSYGLQVTKPG